MDTFSTLRDLSPLALFVVFVLALLKFMSDQSAREAERSQKDADRRTVSYDKMASAMEKLTEATDAQAANTRINTRFTHRAAKTIENTSMEVKALSAAVLTMGTTIPEAIIKNQNGLANTILLGVQPLPERLIALEQKIDQTNRELDTMRQLVESNTQRFEANESKLTQLLSALDTSIRELHESNEMLSKLSRNEGA